jgi:hypothetical protein
MGENSMKEIIFFVGVAPRAYPVPIGIWGNHREIAPTDCVVSPSYNI